MKLSEIRQEYYDSSGTVSSLVRSISLAGIAVGWAIRVGKDSPVQYNTTIGYVFLILVSALACDILQYFFKTLAWGNLNRINEKLDISLEDDVDAPSWFNVVALVLWFLKSILAITGIIILAACLWSCLIDPDSSEVTSPKISTPIISSTAVQSAALSPNAKNTSVSIIYQVVLPSLISAGTAILIMMIGRFFFQRTDKRSVVLRELRSEVAKIKKENWAIQGLVNYNELSRLQNRIEGHLLNLMAVSFPRRNCRVQKSWKNLEKTFLDELGGTMVDSTRHTDGLSEREFIWNLDKLLNAALRG